MLTAVVSTFPSVCLFFSLLFCVDATHGGPGRGRRPRPVGGVGKTQRPEKPANMTGIIERAESVHARAEEAEVELDGAKRRCRSAEQEVDAQKELIDVGGSVRGGGEKKQEE